MAEYTYAIAIFDYFPTILFLIGTIFFFIYFRRREMYKFGWLWLSGGSIVFVAGSMQATWKLIQAINGQEISFLHDYLFVIQSSGFFLMFIGTLLMIRTYTQKKENGMEIIPALAAPIRMSFMLLMIVFSLGTFGLWIYYSFRLRKNKLTGILLIISSVLMLVMGGLGSIEFVNPMMEWIPEITNTLWQIAFGTSGILFCRSCE